MSFDLRGQEAAFGASYHNLPHAQLVPELRLLLAAARPLPFYAGSPALACLTVMVALELRKHDSPGQALPLLREALAELSTLLGASHQATAKTAVQLGDCLHVLGESEEALPLLERAFQTQLAAKDVGHALRQLCCGRRGEGARGPSEGVVGG